jgi:quercetin dioxygenase-like cupin family protein
MSMKARFVAAEDGTRYRVLGSTMTVKTAADDTDGVFEVVVADSRRGADVIAHRHPWAESYYILDGHLDVQIGARTHHVGPGDLVTIPARAVHGFTVTTATARFLHVSIGRGATEAFCELDQRLPEPVAGPDDIPVMLDVAARHGIELVVPAAG